MILVTGIKYNRNVYINRMEGKLYHIFTLQLHLLEL